MDDKGTNSKKTPANKTGAPTPPPTSSTPPQPTPASSAVTEQPTAAPTQPVSPTSQPPIMNSVMPSKKKTGRIIGIIAGSVVLLLAIVAVLLYFFWWRDPQNMVTNAMVNSFQAKKVVSSGKIVMNLGGNNHVDISLKATADVPKTKTEATIKLSVGGVETQQDVKLAVVTDGKGTFYIKVEHLKDILRQMVAAMIKAQGQGSLPVPDTQSATVREQMLKQFDEKFEKIEGKWLKISPQDFQSSRSNKSDQSQCSQEMFEMLNNDQQARKELINAYRKNSFITVKKDTKVESRDGALGFEIDLTSDGKVADKLRAFITSLGETKLGKKITECYGDKALKVTNTDTSSRTLPTLRVWIDPWSHQLKAVEIKMQGSEDNKNQSVTLDMTFDYGKSEQIDVPSNANSLKSVLQDLVGSSSIPPFARGGVSVNQNDEDTDISIER